jgi:response regulator RpfG family c-di-GMP phosphodiesterase
MSTVGVAEERVLKYLREQAGEHFDPAVVEAFLGMLAEGTLQLD